MNADNVVSQIFIQPISSSVYLRMWHNLLRRYATSSENLTFDPSHQTHKPSQTQASRRIWWRGCRGIPFPPSACSLAQPKLEIGVNASSKMMHLHGVTTWVHTSALSSTVLDVSRKRWISGNLDVAFLRWPLGMICWGPLVTLSTRLSMQ